MTWWQTFLTALAPTAITAIALVTQQQIISKREIKREQRQHERDSREQKYAWKQAEYERRREAYAEVLRAYQRYSAEREPENLQLMAAVQRGQKDALVSEVIGTAKPSVREEQLREAIGTAELWKFEHALNEITVYTSGLEWYLMNPQQGKVELAANSRGDLEAGYRDLVRAAKADLENETELWA